jgi:sugar lactone lactonase YvrE
MKTMRKQIIAIVCCFAMFAAPALAFTPSSGLPSAAGPLSEVRTFAGSGDFDDAVERVGAADAAFRFPFNVAVLDDGSVLVSDSGNHVIRRVQDGQVTVYAGFLYLPRDAAGLPSGTLVDGTAATAVFKQPAGLAVDAEGNVYVADSGNHAIRKIDREGNVTTVAGNGLMGMADGKGAEARFNNPQDVAVAADGTIYVADTGNHAIRAISPDGVVTTLNASSDRVVEIVPGYVTGAGDYADGPLADAKFNEPFGLALDARGNLYVSDSGNHLIRYVDLAARKVTTVAGIVRSTMYEPDALYAFGAYADGRADQAGFHFPKGIATTEDGGLLIADSLNHTVRFLHNGRVITLAGSLDAEFGSSDGINGKNELHNPTDVAIQGDRLVIADAYNQKLRIYSLYRLPEGAERDGRIDVALGDSLIVFELPVVMVQSRTMVPAAEIADVLGFEVEESDGRVVLSAGDGRELIFAVNDMVLKLVSADGSESEMLMDVSPRLQNGFVYVPVRFLAEALGISVDWDSVSQTVILRP